MNRFRKGVLGAALVGSTLAGGAMGALLINGSAGAQTSSSSTAQTQQVPPANGQRPAQDQFDPTRGGHVGRNGVRESLLTGDTAEKVRAAALTAVPGGTIQRVETDAEGSPYEAHMTKSDGSQVTVKVDSNFKVTSVEDGAR